MGYKYKVAVVCKTYNHEKYIAEAIESFLIQKTDFDVQIIVHDDASTDSTAMIIREYEQKFPDKIFPIYQTENQYSQGVDGKDRVHEQVVSQIDAEYVALCEGDDYWIDPLKLKIQTDFLDANSNYSASAHSVYVTNAITSKKVRTRERFKNDSTLNCDDILLAATGGVLKHCSIVIRTRVYVNRLNFGRAFRKYGGHYLLLINAALNGEVNYFSKKMGVYRSGVKDSATDRMNHFNEKERILFSESRIEMLEELDLITNGDYSNSINIQKLNEYLKIVKLTFNSNTSIHFNAIDILNDLLFNQLIYSPFVGRPNKMKRIASLVSILIRSLFN
jgi:glycosyltransferase involved in cell wall biosynthesis